MQLPDEPPVDPYEVTGFRVSHTHYVGEDGEENKDEMGTVVLELVIRFPGVDAEQNLAFELEPDHVPFMISALAHHMGMTCFGECEETTEDD